MQAMIDLRSDTVTRPTAAMRAAMAAAEVGDDVYREDPTVRRLEERVAELTGKEAALFVPSGTMGNQIALLCHTQRGDEVIAGEGAHCAFYESGAAPAWSGVQFAFAGRGGLFTAADVEDAIKPPLYYLPRTRVVAIENTHNRAGGRVFPQDDVLAIASVARAHGLALHLDGARLWNASVASGRPVAELAAPFDTVSVCFSKGLGAPVGSALCGGRTPTPALCRRPCMGTMPLSTMEPPMTWATLLRYASWGLLLLLLAGCATPQRASPPAPKGDASWRMVVPKGTVRYQLALGEVSSGGTPFQRVTPTYPADQLASCPPPQEIPVLLIVDEAGKVAEVRVAD
ncbi:MAG TPA: threonine aldolase family protein, partial [Sorangium sp.]|nr:threonine aldolase family protein [Sorangium sp.]